MVNVNSKMFIWDKQGKTQCAQLENSAKMPFYVSN